MKFEYKKVPVPSRAKKFMPPGATVEALKVRHNKEVIGIVLNATTTKGEDLHACFLSGRVIGGFETQQEAAEGLVAS